MIETEVAAYLRADGTLTALLPGGIYARSSLSEAGITSAESTPDVWTGGVFQPCAVVGEGPPVPDYRSHDAKTQKTSQTQRIAIYVYSSTLALTEPATDRIYALMQEHPLLAAWGAQWVGGPSYMRAPELPDVFQVQKDYLIVSMKTPT